MAFSSIAFCAEDKMTIDFHTYPLLCGALIHQSSSMGIHKSGESPFVELTNHKPRVNSSFEMSKLNVTKQFVLTEKVRSFTNNTRNFVRGETFLPRKEIYSHKFPVMALSQLVGGFVGSKSQLGSCGRESFQIWDIIFDKLAEFCRTPQCGCYSLYGSKNPQNCCNLGNNLSQEIFGSFCQESVSTCDGSHIITENSSNPLQDEGSDTLPEPSTVSCNSVRVSVKRMSVIPTCTQGDKFCHTSDVSRQSYAEVAKAFAIAQQSKQQCATASTLKKRRNAPYCEGLRSNLRQFGWRYCHKPYVRNYGSQHMLATSCRKTPRSSKVVSRHKVGVSKRSDTDVNISESNSKKNIYEVKKKSQTALYREVYSDCCQVTDKSTIAENSNRIGSVEDKCVKACTAVKHSSSAVGRVDDCTVFTNKAEDGSMSTVIDASGIVQTSHINLDHYQCLGESATRERYLSDCSTDSDDSFVSFECGVDCKPVTVALVSDSEPSEDGVSDQFSDDDDDNADDDDDDDDDDENGNAETVTGLKEVNARWHRDYAEYSGCEKNPAKVQFACDASLETVYPLITWNYAYRAARCGPWVRMAGDRERFMARIRRMEPLLAVVLSAEHRHCIWSKRMAEESPTPL